MSKYRVQQFLWNISSNVNEEDVKFIKTYLNEVELSLFHKLTKAEQKHSIRVAARVIREYEASFNKSISRLEKKKLIVIALMHDIGKIEKKLNVIDKSLLVILDKITRGKLKRFNHIKKIDVYYNHPQKGAEILKEIGFDKRSLYLVQNHHNNSIIGDKDLDILRFSDSIN